MSDITKLRAAAEAAEHAFEDACTAAGFIDRWHAFRSLDAFEVWAPDLENAWTAYRDALHAYYLARDGARGVLGSRGL